MVRNDASHSDLIFQTSDTTWQAYNDWGGDSTLHGATGGGRAYKVSYNRPFVTRANTPDGRDFFFGTEYPMVRFLEPNGYDVSYQSGIDTDRYGSLLLNHKTFLSVGHDEYWSGNQRTNVEAARNAGVNLAFFSGNEVYWKTRYEPSIDGSSTPYRTLVVYKETKANAKIDPSPLWTGTWRDPRFSPPSDGGRPENSLTGTSFKVHGPTTASRCPTLTASSGSGATPTIATQSPGGSSRSRSAPSATSGTRTRTTASGPAGLFDLSSTTRTTAEVLLDYGSTVAHGHGHPPPDDLPRRQRRPGVRRRHRSSGPGASTTPTTARASPPTCACSRRPSTCSPTWAHSRRPCISRSGRGHPSSTDTTAPDRHDHLPRRRAPPWPTAPP